MKFFTLTVIFIISLHEAKAQAPQGPWTSYIAAETNTNTPNGFITYSLDEPTPLPVNTPIIPTESNTDTSNGFAASSFGGGVLGGITTILFIALGSFLGSFLVKSCKNKKDKSKAIATPASNYNNTSNLEGKKHGIMINELSNENKSLPVPKEIVVVGNHGQELNDHGTTEVIQENTGSLNGLINVDKEILDQIKQEVIQDIKQEFKQNLRREMTSKFINEGIIDDSNNSNK